MVKIYIESFHHNNKHLARFLYQYPTENTDL